jgi:hypothetical protein
LQPNKNQAKTKDTKGKKHMNNFWKWYGAYVFFILAGFVGGKVWLYCYRGMVPSTLEVWGGLGFVGLGLVCWAMSRLIPND